MVNRILRSSIFTSLFHQCLVLSAAVKWYNATAIPGLSAACRDLHPQAAHRISPSCCHCWIGQFNRLQIYSIGQCRDEFVAISILRTKQATSCFFPIVCVRVRACVRACVCVCASWWLLSIQLAAWQQDSWNRECNLAAKWNSPSRLSSFEIPRFGCWKQRFW